MFDTSKKYRTKDDREFKFQEYYKESRYPVHGYIVEPRGNLHLSWTDEGSFLIGSESPADLIEVKVTLRDKLTARYTQLRNKVRK